MPGESGVLEMEGTHIMLGTVVILGSRAWIWMPRNNGDGAGGGGWVMRRDSDGLEDGGAWRQGSQVWLCLRAQG